MVLNEVLDMEECLEEVMEDMDPDLFPAIQTGRAAADGHLSSTPPFSLAPRGRGSVGVAYDQAGRSSGGHACHARTHGKRWCGCV